MQSINSGKSVGISAKLTLWAGISVVLILAITSAVSYFDSRNNTHKIAKRQSVKNYARCGCFL
ncbi:hypothetical protein HUM34_001147 [Campylobacter jejuni]|nr:hypothetical protein [Campylobacter jejuni]